MEKGMAQEVETAFDRCLQRYPAVQISYEDFRSRIDEILSREVSPPDQPSQTEALPLIHYEDLFLAMACSRQDRIAWEYFADDYMPLLRKFSMQAYGGSFDGEDLAQEIFVKMLKEGNRLAGYNGRGSLAGWLRAAVAHAAIDRFRRARRQVSLEDHRQEGLPADLADVPKEDDGEALDARWGPVVSNAVGDIIAKLAPRDRLVLGLYYLRGVPLLAIGRHFGIHEATVSRWLEGLRRDIRKQVEMELRRKHGLRAGEVRSLWKYISLSSVAEPIAQAISSTSTTDMVKTEGSSGGPKKSARRVD
jgi:RNA polymerase sigma-70 factor